VLTRTTIGLHTRAAATDFRTARLLGVRANRVIAFAVVFSVCSPPRVPSCSPSRTPSSSRTFALEDTIIVLVGVVVGGIDRLWTATLGGFAIGFVSVLVNAALPTDKTVFLPSVVFALVIVVLLLRPQASSPGVAGPRWSGCEILARALVELLGPALLVARRRPARDDRLGVE
jgi:branched-chain amino acid transport system permease protein